MGVSNLICNFVCYEDEPMDEWYKTKETDEEFADDAAQEFAAYAQDNMDMWEHDNSWNGNYAIVVRGDKGFRKVFEVEREFDPYFNVWEKK